MHEIRQFIPEEWIIQRADKTFAEFQRAGGGSVDRQRRREKTQHGLERTLKLNYQIFMVPSSIN